MPEQNTDDQTSQNTGENETHENEESQTDGDANDTSNDSEDVENNTSDFYEEELKRLQGVEEEKKKLEAQLEEKNRQVEIKNRALQAEKKKTRSSDESVSKEDLKKEILTEIRLEHELDVLASNKAERDEFMHHYKNSIVRSGNVQQDLLNARAIANASRISDLLSRQSAESEAEDNTAASMLGGGYNGARGGVKAQTATRREAEKILKSFKGFKPEMLKHLDNYLPR